MESQIEKISAVEYRVRVEIPWESVSPRLDAKLRDLRKKARLPGFRPGKVPPQMIERLFGKSVRDELARELVDETFQDAVVQHSKVPLTQPALESNDLARGRPFTYSARFEVPPEIEPKEYTGVEVRRRPAIVDDAKVDAQLKAKQDELTEIQPLPEGIERTQTQAGDVWTIDIEGSIGETRISRKDHSFVVGDEASELVPGLQAIVAELPLSAVGTSREVRFLPTQERIRSDLRGQDAVLTLGFREVRQKVVPALDDDFARDTGEAESIDELRAKFADAVREEDKEQAEHEARQRLVTTLLERNDFEVAPSLIAREVEAQVDLFKRQLAQQGLSLARVGMSEAQLGQQMRPQATFNVKAFLLLDAIGKAEEINVTEDELNEELKKMAEESNQNIDRMRATMEKNNQILLLRAQIREAKILDFLMEKAIVTEAPDPTPEAEAGGESGASEEAAS
ncbi:MAG: trigger factor [Myxococcales bacterium]|nr:trigger factor [Myxococcales bacterium]